MKIWFGIIFFLYLTVFPLWAGDVYVAPHPRAKAKPKAKTSCTIFRGKYTVSDQLEYRFGVVAGQNIATIKSKKSDSQDVITGMLGGVAAQVIWPKGFTLQPEVLYSRKGCIFTGSGVKYNMDYLEVPVKAMYRLPIARVKPFAFIAPYGAYAIRLTEDGNVASDDTYSSQINKFDCGIGAGAGFDAWNIQVSFKYTWGFAQVLNETFPVRNKVFTVSAGLFF